MWLLPFFLPSSLTFLPSFLPSLLFFSFFCNAAADSDVKNIGYDDDDDEDEDDDDDEDEDGHDEGDKERVDDEGDRQQRADAGNTAATDLDESFGAQDFAAASARLQSKSSLYRLRRRRATRGGGSRQYVRTDDPMVLLSAVMTDGWNLLQSGAALLALLSTVLFVLGSRWVRQLYVRACACACVCVRVRVRVYVCVGGEG